jgi:hypothetical protein
VAKVIITRALSKFDSPRRYQTLKNIASFKILAKTESFSVAMAQAPELSEYEQAILMMRTLSGVIHRMTAIGP